MKSIETIGDVAPEISYMLTNCIGLEITVLRRLVEVIEARMEKSVIKKYLYC